MVRLQALEESAILRRRPSHGVKPGSAQGERSDDKPLDMPVRQAHPFDEFDKLTASRLRMTLSRVEWVRVPSGVEGQANLALKSPASRLLQLHYSRS